MVRNLFLGVFFLCVYAGVAQLKALPEPFDTPRFLEDLKNAAKELDENRWIKSRSLYTPEEKYLSFCVYLLNASRGTGMHMSEYALSVLEYPFTMGMIVGLSVGRNDRLNPDVCRQIPDVCQLLLRRGVKVCYIRYLLGVMEGVALCHACQGLGVRIAYAIDAERAGKIEAAFFSGLAWTRREGAYDRFLMLDNNIICPCFENIAARVGDKPISSFEHGYREEIQLHLKEQEKVHEKQRILASFSPSALRCCSSGDEHVGLDSSEKDRSSRRAGRFLSLLRVL